MPAYPTLNPERDRLIELAFSVSREADGVMTRPAISLYLPEGFDLGDDEYHDALPYFAPELVETDLSAVSVEDENIEQPPEMFSPPLDIDATLAEIKRLEDENAIRSQVVRNLQQSVRETRNRLSAAVVAFQVGHRQRITPAENARNEALAFQEYKRRIASGETPPPRGMGVGPSLIDRIAAAGNVRGAAFRRGATSKQDLLERRAGVAIPPQKPVRSGVSLPPQKIPSAR